MPFAFDPEFAQVLAAMPQQPVTPLAAGDVAGRRAAVEQRLALLNATQPAPADVSTTDHRLTTADGATIAMRWYAPQTTPAAPGPAAVHFHGGGMILGSFELFDGALRSYASAAGTPILSVDYRLAPEHPHPVPVEDAYAGLIWLHEHGAELNVDPARIAVFGESAGGGIAAGVALLARDRQGPPIARQILIYPMLDDRTLDPDPQLVPFATWTWDDNRTGWGALLGDRAGTGDVPAYAAPARVADPTGLPPAYIEVGQLDIFRDEDLTYALRLGQAGVPVELHVHPGLPHGFEGVAPSIDPTRRAMADRIRVLASF